MLFKAAVYQIPNHSLRQRPLIVWAWKYVGNMWILFIRENRRSCICPMLNNAVIPSNNNAGGGALSWFSMQHAVGPIKWHFRLQVKQELEGTLHPLRESQCIWWVIISGVNLQFLTLPPHEFHCCCQRSYISLQVSCLAILLISTFFWNDDRRYSLLWVIQRSHVTLLVYITGLRMREWEY